MAEFRFSKMHGAGNDFIVSDGKLHAYFAENPARPAALCHRKCGIGADGIFFLSEQGNGRWKMDFYNSDGSRAEMCGNGLRCAALYAARHSQGVDKPVFETDAGTLATEVLSDPGGTGPAQVRIDISVNGGFRHMGKISGHDVYFGNTGVPHAVVIVDDTEKIDVEKLGAELRYHGIFAPSGTNVDFAELRKINGAHRIRTYERGVEGETLACGTGICASALVLHEFFGEGQKVALLSRSGAELAVDIPENWNILCKIKLTGPAVEVCRGHMNLDGDALWN